MEGITNRQIDKKCTDQWILSKERHKNMDRSTQKYEKTDRHKNMKRQTDRHNNMDSYRGRQKHEQKDSKTKDLDSCTKRQKTI